MELETSLPFSQEPALHPLRSDMNQVHINHIRFL